MAMNEQNERCEYEWNSLASTPSCRCSAHIFSQVPMRCQPSIQNRQWIWYWRRATSQMTAPYFESYTAHVCGRLVLPHGWSLLSSTTFNDSRRSQHWRTYLLFGLNYWYRSLHTRLTHLLVPESSLLWWLGLSCWWLGHGNASFVTEERCYISFCNLGRVKMQALSSIGCSLVLQGFTEILRRRDGSASFLSFWYEK
jgi:hypothetical protein